MVVRIGKIGGTFGSFASASFAVPEFLARPLVARISTGANVVRPVWFLWEQDSFWVLIGPWSRLGDRLARDPLFELVVDDCDLATGSVRQVIARGRGTVERFDVERGRRKLRRYLGSDEERWDVRFSLDGDPNERGTRWAHLAPDTMWIADLSFVPASTPAGRGR
ncbi:MAG TPA: pyridoxamine 5'-phosphate oxidase family protein [Actinoplanes sp.]|nr:pyridoxamine 5'-phosphate oxidase family protein [Actinoplanes sp.]